MDKDSIKKAVEVLNKGGIVIFPTDTAFAIGCRIDDEEAVGRLFMIRKRPQEKAVPVLVSSVEMAKDYLLSIPDDVNEKLIRRYWPGALTIILPCRIEKVPSLVRGGRNTLGVRLPDHDVACEIIKRVGVPVLGPSANFSGDKTPFSFSELDKQLVELVDFVVPGETKGLGRASTVVDCSTKPWRIIREGAVKIEEI